MAAPFDFRDDNSGQDMMAALLNAADRGVKVQILVDGINGTLYLRGSRNFRELTSHENVEVKLYNPITLIKPWKNNYRMHDKYLLADDFTQMIYFLVIISTHIMRIGIFWSMKRFRVRVILTIRFKIISKIYGIFPAVECLENMKELMAD